MLNLGLCVTGDAFGSEDYLGGGPSIALAFTSRDQGEPKKNATHTSQDPPFHHHHWVLCSRKVFQ
ncbi:hypothetical protein BC826DRAFT_1051152, partial [Russula brevipes]